MYTRFEIMQDMIKEIITKKADLAQAEIVKILESLINFE